MDGEQPRAGVFAVRGAVAAVAALLAALPATAAERRAAERAAFVREHPCPSTGMSKGRCPGYVVDHVVPLCAGGADSPANMQWQTVQESRRKDVDEHRICREMRKGQEDQNAVGARMKSPLVP
jgi:hypothetical protein